MRDAAEELLNVYDAQGRVTGALPRREAKRSGLAVGAVNALVVNARGELLMQRRPAGKENGGLWDKSVGGHVSAGESFDATMAREAGEELFDDPHSRQVQLVADGATEAAPGFDLAHGVLLRPLERRLSLRDVRHAPGGGLRRVLYHLAIYAGRTELPLDGFRPQASEVDELRYVPVDEVDAMLLAGRLAPNMAFLWLTQAQALLRR
jgi:8-oxo-dGTP pyrophosphatase MutT (NUDIX family)